MTVIQTIVGGGGGSGTPVDATSVLITFTGTVFATGTYANLLNNYYRSSDKVSYKCSGYDITAYPPRMFNANNRAGSIYRYALSNSDMPNIAAALKTMLPALENGRYSVSLLGVGNTTSNGSSAYTSDFYLDVSAGNYTLSPVVPFSSATLYAMRLDNATIELRLGYIAKMVS